MNKMSDDEKTALLKALQANLQEKGCWTAEWLSASGVPCPPVREEELARLKEAKEALAETVCGKNIYEITTMIIGELSQFLQDMKLTTQQELIGSQILKEIRARVGFLIDVGLDYLSLSRAT